MKKLSAKKLLIFLSLTLVLFLQACLPGSSLSSWGPVPPTETQSTVPTSLPDQGVLPLVMQGCYQAAGCPHAHPIHEYLGEGAAFSYGMWAPTIIGTGDEVWFWFKWCARDSTTLAENLAHIESVFTIDGVSYAGQLQQGDSSMQDPDNPSITVPCVTVGVVLSGWQTGVLHEVVIGAHLTGDVSNGWDTFTAGDYLYTFVINPSEGASENLPPVPTPTRTRTPGGGYTPPTSTEVSSGHEGDHPPTNTPLVLPTDTAVVIPTDTEEPPPPTCSGVVYFAFNASDGGDIGHMYISFPDATYMLEAMPGGTDSLDGLCPGVSYSYDAWDFYQDCSMSGTVSSGDSVTLNCP